MITIKQKYSATLVTLFMLSSTTTTPWQWPNFQKVNTLGMYCVGCVGLTHILYSEYLKPWLTARREKQEKVRKKRELRQRYQEYITAQRHYESERIQHNGCSADDIRQSIQNSLYLQ